MPRPKVVPHVLRPSAGAARTWLGSGPGLGLGLLLWLRLRRRGWSGCYGCGRQCTNAGSRLRRRTGLAHPVKRHARARARSHCDRSVSPRHRRSPRGGGLRRPLGNRSLRESIGRVVHEGWSSERSVSAAAEPPRGPPRPHGSSRPPGRLAHAALWCAEPRVTPGSSAHPRPPHARAATRLGLQVRTA